MSQQRIYLDHNATTPLRPKAKEAFVNALGEFGNPSSIHSFGRFTKSGIANARRKIGEMLNVSENRVIFTSGGTESNNTALSSIPGAKIFVSPLEHSSVTKPISAPFFLKVYETGALDLVSLEKDISDPYPRKLVSVSFAHNETGIIQDLESIVEIAQKYHAFVHTDAVQALARVHITPRALESHMLSFSSHKIGGPLGIGLLILPETQIFSPLILGGGQQKGFRAGSENYPAIMSFAVALEEAMNELNSNQWSHVESLRDFLEAEIIKICPDTFIVGNEVQRLPNTASFSMPGVESVIQVVNFDLEGIAVSSGSACSSGTIKPSDALKAMKIPEKHLKSILRVSLGINTTKEEIMRFISVWKNIYETKKSTASESIE